MMLRKMVLVLATFLLIVPGANAQIAYNGATGAVTETVNDMHHSLPHTFAKETLPSASSRMVSGTTYYQVRTPDRD